MQIKNVNLKNIAVNDNSGFITGNSQLLYLDAGNSASYPGSGTVWYDLSGNTNNTTGTSNTTYNSGNGGYFNFVDPGYFTTASSKYNTAYTGKTVFLSAYLVGSMSVGQFRCMFGSSSGVSNRNFNLYLYYTGSAYQLHFSAGGAGSFSSNMNYASANWGTFAVTHTTGGAVTYYYNGQQNGTASQAFSQYLSTTSENVGASDNYWNGRVGVVSIYGSALTANQILMMHNSIRGRYGI